MNSFRTPVKTPKSDFKIDYNSKAIFIGSCFSENIGNKLNSDKFSTDINPFGVLYNPISISKSIELLINRKSFIADDLEFHNDLWFSFSHHSSFSDLNKDTCLQKINNRINSSHKKLKEAKFLFISYGTSRVYIDKESNKVVSNCHKLPASRFEQRLINTDESYQEAVKMVRSITRFNPEIQIVFTVSPIRHWKDGHFANQVNKSILFILINKLIENFKNVSYFPSYEIMMDDLRDYRFYADDMIHLNETAINYIYEQFSESYFDKTVNETLNKIQKINKAFKHRPYNPESDTYLKFALNNIESINKIVGQFPNLDFSEELALFRNVLK